MYELIRRCLPLQVFVHKTNKAHTTADCMLSKSQLAVNLSKLRAFEAPKAHLEQYPTDSEVAADLLHHAAMLGDVEGKHIVDFGAGTGVLGIAALMLDADQVTFLEIDLDALTVLRSNVSSFANYVVVHGAITATPADVVVMNPPFGIQQPHADKPFLMAACQSAPVIYSIHSAGSEPFIDAVASQHGFTRTHTWDYKMLLKQTMDHHTKKHDRINVIAVRLEKTPKSL